MPLDLPSRRRGIDRSRREFIVGQASARSAFDFRAQALNQFRWLFSRIHLPAAQARAITAMQRFTRRGKKIDVLARRLFCRAGGSAENSGRAHADEKDSFKARAA